jgi:hypothetical protein
MTKIILLLIAIGLPISIVAQLQLGMKIGYNLSNLRYLGPEVNIPPDTKPISSFNVGILASIPLSKKFRLQPETIFSVQGSKYWDSATIKQLNSYIILPILIKYLLKSGLYAETGPQMGILIDANLSDANGKINNKSQYNSTDWTWVFGIGYQMRRLDLGIDLRYNFGYTDISPQIIGSSIKVMNSVFQFDLYYLFPKF